MTDFEKLGVFYLGKEYDPHRQTPGENLLLYESKDLCTHAVCVGMTGSGKTGLCLALLEEAAIDHIPAICIDPKGDLGNLLLTFPDLAAENFRPWIDPAEATNQGRSIDEMAEKTARTWREGLAAWGQQGDRIRRFRESVDLTIYTPGSSAGVPLTVLRSFAAPPESTLGDADAFRERLTAATAGLLSLLGVGGDPLRSREHILVANLLEQAWRAGEDVDLPTLIRAIQQPPFQQVGVIDLESFFPAKDRFALAMTLNNLMASPGFSAWTEGEPLDIQRLLYTPEGKPRLTILSIAHLSDAERMFFVTILLNEVVAWMRTQSGTSSLRAILYMDEVFGYFPPTANPPSKIPMLTLLKQARAYGLGVVLATQNPVDLDYKGLSNAGTWFLGRLQTERDKARVLDGLEGASTAAGAGFDRKSTERILSSLGNRVFLMNNVHDDAPQVFQTRWALSYLRGPLTRDQIGQLMAEKKRSAPAASAPAAAAQPIAALPVGERPMLPPGITELFEPLASQPPAGAKVVYRPQLLGEATVHFVDAKAGINHTQECLVSVEVGDSLGNPAWTEAHIELAQSPHFESQGETSAQFATLPAAFMQAKTYASLATQLKEHLFRSHRLELFQAPELKRTSQPGEEESAFRAQLAHHLHEQRDLASEKLKQKYAARFASLQEQIRKAQQRVAKQKEQASATTMTSMITFGSSLLGALLGRKLASATNVTKAASSARSAARAMKDRQNVGHAEDTVEAYQQRLADLEAEFEAESEKLTEAASPDALKIEPLPLAPKKADILIRRVALLWRPWFVLADGRLIGAS
jgi:hypothetical protein